MKFFSIFCLVLPASVLLFGQDSPVAISSRITEAKSLMRQGQDKEALSLLSGIQSDDSVLEKGNAVTLHLLTGQCLYNLQQYEKAVTSYETAFSNLESNDTLQAMLHYQLGLTRYRLSKYAEATEHIEQARDLYRQLYGKEDKKYTSCLNTLGFFYKVQAKYNQAEKTFQEARQVNLRLTGGEDLQYARIINNLAAVYCQLNRFDKADELYRTSLRIKEQVSGRQSRDYAQTLYNLANFQESLGRYEKAKSSIQEGVDIYTALDLTGHPEYLKFLDYLAILTRKTGNIPEAESLFKDALQRREEAGATQRDDYALNLLNIGDLYEAQGKPGKAMPYIEKALPLTATIYGRDHPTYASVLSTLANIQSEQGMPDEARSNYEEAVRIVQRTLGRDHTTYFHAQFAYARFLRRNGQQKEAIAIYKKIDRIPRNYLKRASRFLSEKELSEKVEEFRSFSTEIYSMLRMLPNDSDLAQLAYNSTLYFRGYILSTLQQIREGMLKAQTISDSRDELISLHRQLENELNRPLTERGNTAELEQRIAEIESEIANTLGSFSDDKGEFHWEDVQMALMNEEAAVEYIAFSDPMASDSVFYGALLLTPFADAPVFVRLCPESAFSSLLPEKVVRKADYISSIYNFSERGAVAIGGKKVSLTDLIWQPVEDQLPGITRVYLVPDGLLHRIALSALPTSLETVVADSVELVLLGSTRNVVPDDNRILSYTGRKALVVGGISYDAETSGDLAMRSSSPSDSNEIRNIWDFLPWAEKESRDIAGLLKNASFQVSLLDGFSASEPALTDSLQADWRILHIATHGFFKARTRSENGSNSGFYGTGLMNSGLVLAGANQGLGDGMTSSSADGLLTAYEVSRLDLSQTELVVLSACETALGDLADEEGVYGLQRAFRLAGADKLIMSLWQVPDRETKDFMVSFYQNWIGDNSSIREAFQKTQLEFRKRFVNPYQWAGFVLLE